MKNFIVFILLLVTCYSAEAQDRYDRTGDGLIEKKNINIYEIDLNGNGIAGDDSFINYSHVTAQIPYEQNINFVSFWSSPAGAFGNCWDGAVGYFDGDTLLDIAGYTFSPSKFYIWEQTPAKPDSFALVFEHVKTEGAGFGPITFGDTDNDGKIEIIVADFATFTRIYIFECSGNNLYESKNTQSNLVHTNDGKQGRYLYIGDLNKNGKKEIICGRGDTGGGMIRIWEQDGTTGSHNYSGIYTYTTPTYIFSQGGMGDSDNDGYDEIFITYGGLPTFTTYIRRIEYDSASASFVHHQFQANSIGMPASYRIADINDDGLKELIASANSINRASVFIFKSTGTNSYQYIDSVIEVTDNNNMLSQDIKILQGESVPSLITGSFNGFVYVYQYNNGVLAKRFQKSDYPGPAIRRVYWTNVESTDGYFNTWSSSNSNGTFYIHKKDLQTGIIKNNKNPRVYYLYQNYPNPFNSGTIIKFGLFETALVKLTVYDILGKAYSLLSEKYLAAGSYQVRWNGSGFPGGTYFYKLEAYSISSGRQLFSETKKMVLIK